MNSQEAPMSDLPNPSEHPQLREYLRDVVAWHGYIRFLGLPTFQNSPDVVIDELYVHPALSSSYLSPESDPQKWDTKSAIDLLLAHKRLVVLGDPGSGKSTLINWLAWYLAAGLSTPLPGGLSEMLPLPMVLRELDLRAVSNFDQLLDAFLARPVAEKLRAHKSVVLEYLKAGKALILIDGVDEVGKADRHRLRSAVLDGFAGFPDAFALCTSRIVGYDEAPLQPLGYRSDEEPDSQGSLQAGIPDAKRRTISKMRWIVTGKPRLEYQDTPAAVSVYVAPFDDERIAAFALNWYRDASGSKEESRLLRDQFISAVRANQSILRLARTPNLLTIMALVFRVRYRLPDGRALLYNDIAQAYLESIDTARHLKDDFSWQSKKRWLARIGFEMQLRRSQQEPDAPAHAQTELLFSRKDVLAWITAAMQSSPEPFQDGYAERYLEWVARRSGLLLPRGEDQYAFLHLSFQEYFAALHIQEQIENPDWLDWQSSGAEVNGLFDERVSKGALYLWAGQATWQEAMVFLFELCAQKSGWVRRLLSWCFETALSDPSVKALPANAPRYFDTAERVSLLIRLCGNPHSGMSAAERKKNAQDCIGYALAEQAELFKGAVPVFFRMLSALDQLLSQSDLVSLVLDTLAISPPSTLQLVKTSAETIESVARQVPMLEDLVLLLPQITTFIPLAKFAKLQSLTLSTSEICDLTTIQALTHLKRFTMIDSRVNDLSPLAALTNLQELWLSGAEVNDLSPLTALTHLRELRLDSAGVSDVSPLKALPNLRRLHLAGTGVLDVSPLKGLIGLLTLNLGGTKVEDISSLAALRNLQNFDLSMTHIADWSALKVLTNLRMLNLDSATFNELSILKPLTKLEFLFLSRTQISDLSALLELAKLKTLFLSEAKVHDLTPLRALSKLEKLWLPDCDVRELSVLTVLPNLKDIFANKAQAAYLSSDERFSHIEIHSLGG
jgi:internalin A